SGNAALLRSYGIIQGLDEGLPGAKGEAVRLPGLRAVRERKLMTQAELAERAGMQRVTVSRIETGAAEARISTVRKLAAALDVDPEVLMESVSGEKGKVHGER
ncbi:MAG TPA: helix-turn-helix transcriptional regulator, partial [Chloroflexota bacterium]|nr:helix-turn-helix transcriptional regulator [Chloroflexota bacterium]